jgi:hypothetical protein
MVLVSIASRVREHEIRLNAQRKFLARILHFPEFRGEKTVAELVKVQLFCGIATQEKACATGRFLGAPLVTAEHGPMHCRASSHETQHSSAASNLNVVGMSTQAKNAKRPPARPCQ